MDLSRFLHLRLQGAHIDLPVFNDKGSPPNPPPPADPAKQAEAEAAANRYHITSPFGKVRWVEHKTIPAGVSTTNPPKSFGDWWEENYPNSDTGPIHSPNFDKQYADYVSKYRTDAIPDPQGLSGWEQIIDLSPDQQKMLADRQKIASMLGGRSEDILSKTPSTYEFKGAEDPASNQFFMAQKKLLDVAFNKDEERERQRLTNQGLPEGSQAFREAMDDFGRRKSDAYGTASANALDAGFRQDITTRQQNLNEVAAALGGQQLQPIGGGGSPLDVSGAFTNYNAGVNRQYQGQLAGYNAEVAQGNQTTSAIAAIVAAMMMASDRRLKTDILLLGEILPGINLYKYRYIHGGPMRYGVMADEVEKVIPDAVHVRDDGYKVVDYFMVFGDGADEVIAA